MKIGELYTIGDLVQLIGTDKQKEMFAKNNKLVGDPKKSLVKKLDSLCVYEQTKIGRKIAYKIVEIYDVPKEIIDNRTSNGAHMIKFTEHLEVAIAAVILSELESDENVDELKVKGFNYDMPYFTISSSRLMMLTGVVNGLYYNYKNKRNLFNKEVMNNALDANTLNLVFDKVDSLKNSINSAINRLSKNKKLISCVTALKVEGHRKREIIFEGTKFTSNEKFREIWVEDSDNYDRVKKIKKKVMLEMGIENYSTIISNKVTLNKFRKILNKRIKEELGVESCFTVNKITVMQKEWLEDYVAKSEDRDILPLINSLSSFNILLENAAIRKEKNKDLLGLNSNGTFVDEFNFSELDGYKTLIERKADKESLNKAKEKCYKGVGINDN